MPKSYICSMFFIDTHTHLYLDNFEADRADVINRAAQAGITTMLLPNIDAESIRPMLQLCDAFPDHCFPMIGLHPTSVADDYEQQLAIMEKELAKEKFVAIGEIGLDLYWDKSFKDHQIKALRIQMEWAKDHNLPVAIHTRDAFPLILEEVEAAQNGQLRGVFHCFSGNSDDAARAVNLGFYLGIGGVITYKKSDLAEAIAKVPIEHLLLETDSPFLPPTPYRGKRNESVYLLEIAQKLAETKQLSMNQIAQITTQNARQLFNLPTP
jgi:TatD DNase family protein